MADGAGRSDDGPADEVEAVRDHDETLAYSVQDVGTNPYTVESQIEMQARGLHRMADEGGWKRRTAQVYVWLCILGPLVALVVCSIWAELAGW